MRIRSIRPEFWSSEDIAAMDWHTRLVYIGLWSYVDDNGVGRDVERLILADLFPLDDDLSEASVRVHGALKRLNAGGQIARYKVGGKPYLHITAWEKHQKINRPSEGRYPLPTCENTDPHDTLSEPSVSPHGTLSAGEGEKGRRGEGDLSCASADAEREFDEWYDAYPRKRGRGQALKAYRAARKKASAQVLLDAIEEQAPALMAKGPEFCPYPATWLNGERWADTEPAAARPLGAFPADGTDEEKDAWARAQPLPTDGAYYGGSRR